MSAVFSGCQFGEAFNNLKQHRGKVWRKEGLGNEYPRAKI